MRNRLFVLLAATLLLCCATSCRKEKAEDIVPVTPVVNDTTPHYADLVLYAGLSGSELTDCMAIAADITVESGNMHTNDENTVIADTLIIDSILCPCTVSVRFKFMPTAEIDPAHYYESVDYNYSLNTFTRGKLYRILYYFGGVGSCTGDTLLYNIEHLNALMPLHTLTFDKDGGYTMHITYYNDVDARRKRE